MKSFIENLKQLKEFNPAIVYLFEPEVSITLPFGEQSWRQMFYLCSQQNDMLATYLFVQEKILSMVRNKSIFHRMSAQHIISWLNQIHQKIAYSLSNDYNEQPGKFTEGALIQWHYGNFMMDLYGTYIDGDHTPYTDFHSYILNYIKIHQNRIALTEDQIESAVKFYKLLFVMKIDGASSVSSENVNLQSKLKWPNLSKALHGLRNAYHANDLSAEEKNTVEKNVKFFLEFSERQKLMQEFAAELIDRWKQCDPNNIDEVIKLAYFVFFNITENHPYFNGNGRTATCFMNLVLRSMNKPSILLRNPGESENSASSYSQAIREIKTNPSIFMRHIKARILAAEVEAYQDIESRKLIELRMKYNENYQDAMTKYDIPIIDSVYTLLERWLAMERSRVTRKYSIKQCLEYHIKHFDEAMLYILREQAVSKVEQIIAGEDFRCGWVDESFSEIVILLQDEKEFARIKDVLQKTNFSKVNTQEGIFQDNNITKKAFRIALSSIDFEKLMRIGAELDYVNNLTSSISNCNL